MNLTAFEKFITLIKYIFSSFLSIELLIFSILLFVILIINMKRRKKIVTYTAIGLYLSLLIGTMIAYNEYVILCFKTLFKGIIRYICFPTTVAFFSTIVLITIIMIYTLFSKKLSKFKKISNYLFFSILYYLFMSFIALGAYYGIDLVDTTLLYQNDTILSIVQISNFLLLIWLIYTGFYYLFRFFKKKYD
ncbi:MAG: hypothetical protein IKH54_05240 [Bacilli bacterium]|nr:hypothetical protein [Bacilli bacterium]